MARAFGQNVCVNVEELEWVVSFIQRHPKSHMHGQDYGSKLTFYYYSSLVAGISHSNYLQKIYQGDVVTPNQKSNLRLALKN